MGQVERLMRIARHQHAAAARLEQQPQCLGMIGLPVHETVTGGMNIYATEPEAFDDDAVVLAQTFAGYAAVGLANAHLYDSTATLAQQMQVAMESRAVIEQAKGIIMGDRHCSAEEAFQILSKLSQDTNRKLRDIAQALVDQASADRPS